MKAFSTHTLLLLILVSSVILPQQMKTFKFDADMAAFITEVKGMAVFENGKVTISFIPSADQREKEYQQLDLQKDDEIQFVNGKRIKTITDFKKYFGEAEVGKEVKFGIKRNDQRFIVTFKKAKQEMGGRQIERMEGGGKGHAKVEGGKVIIGGKKLDLDSLKKAGGNVIIKSDGKK
jgi:hypothetical protein